MKTRLLKAVSRDKEFVRKLHNLCARYFFIKRYIAKKEHGLWWKKTKDRIYIIYRDNKKAGYLRVSHTNEIAIAILPEFRGKGVGKDAIGLLPDDNYFASVLASNKASIVLFKSCGFKEIRLQKNRKKRKKGSL